MSTKTSQPSAVRYEEWKVERVIEVADCDRKTAWNYLVAEEWCLTEALTALLGDRCLGVAAMNADQVRTLVAEKFPEAMNSPVAQAFAALSGYADSEQAIFAYEAETSRLYRAGFLSTKQHLARVLALGVLLADLDSQYGKPAWEPLHNNGTWIIGNGKRLIENKDGIVSRYATEAQALEACGKFNKNLSS